MSNMTTKQEALNRLNAIEQEQKELRKVIENFDKCSKLTYKDVISIEIAEEVLKDCKEHIQYFENQFCRKNDWVKYKLETVIKAVNYLENNNKIWIKDWNNPDEYYYTPYFKMNNNSGENPTKGSFSYDGYVDWNADSDVGFGWGFKSKELMLFVVDKFLNDYKIIFKGE